MTTIAERASRGDLPKEGVRCPECDRYCKVYQRPITSTMARWLISLVRRWEKEPRWYSTSESWSLAINRGTGDIGKLAYWGLADSAVNTHPSKRGSGWWLPTRAGIQFVYGAIRVPKHAIIYNDKCINLVGDPVSIQDCLGKRFDYGLLMRDEL